MATTVTAAPTVLSVSNLSPSSLRRNIQRWIAYRDTVAALSELSQRDLSDIGVDITVKDYAWRVTAPIAR